MRAKQLNEINFDDEGSKKALAGWTQTFMGNPNFSATVRVEEPFEITFTREDDYAKLTYLLQKYRIPFEELETIEEDAKSILTPKDFSKNLDTFNEIFRDAIYKKNKDRLIHVYDTNRITPKTEHKVIRASDIWKFIEPVYMGNEWEGHSGLKFITLQGDEGYVYLGQIGMLDKRLEDKKMFENLKFSDGMEFDTSGPLRPEHRYDGWYVVGQGMLIPVDSKDEALEYIAKRQGGEEFKKYVATGKPQGRATKAWDKYLRQ